MSTDELLDYIKIRLNEMKERADKLDIQLEKIENIVMKHIIDCDIRSESKKVWDDRIWSIIIRLLTTMIASGGGVWIGFSIK